jgi:hypothetical protein
MDKHYLNGFWQVSMHPQAHKLEQEMMLAQYLQTVSLAHFLHIQEGGKSSGRLSSVICGNHSPFS